MGWWHKGPVGISSSYHHGRPRCSIFANVVNCLPRTNTSLCADPFCSDVHCGARRQAEPRRRVCGGAPWPGRVPAPPHRFCRGVLQISVGRRGGSGGAGAIRRQLPADPCAWHPRSWRLWERVQRTLPVCQFPLPAIHAILLQVVLFTAGLEDYAAPICDAIEARYPGAFHHRLYRPATVACEAYPCVKVGGQAAMLQKAEQLAPESCTATDQMANRGSLKASREGTASSRSPASPMPSCLPLVQPSHSTPCLWVSLFHATPCHCTSVCAGHEPAGAGAVALRAGGRHAAGLLLPARPRRARAAGGPPLL